MNADLREKLMIQLVRHEGKKNLMYHDRFGVETIGIGHNLRAKRISDAAVAQIFNDDIADVERDVERELPWTAALSLPRQAVIFDMAFNLGIAGLLDFTKMLAAIQSEDWVTAAKEMQQSRWAGQVGRRADRLSQQLLTDVWQGETP